MLHPSPVINGLCPNTCSSTSNSDREPRLRTERLWQEYFTDPSQWWDNRLNKTKPTSSDFMHKSTKELLWIDGWYNPRWVKYMLENKEADSWASKGVNRSKVLVGHPMQEQAFSNSKEFVLVGDLPRSGQMYRDSLRLASEGQQLLEVVGWEMLQLEEAVTILDQVAELPSIDNLVCVLQKCRKTKDLAYAKRVHAYIRNNRMESHRSLGNYIVPMFVECGSVSDAQQVFNRLVHRNEHSWTSLILGYIECGNSQHALDLYWKMQEDGIQPSSYTLMALVKACARLKDMERGQEIHADIVQKGFEGNIFVGNTLVDMYVKCGSLAKAQEVFDKLPVRGVVSWTALTAGYAEYGPGEEALKCFERMQLEGISPNAVTFLCVLKACGNIGAIDKGREIHADIAQKGFDRDLSVGNTLIDMYAKCGSLAEAQEAFDNLPVRDVVSWTALIAGYAAHGTDQEALKHFEQMQQDGISPNAVTFLCILKACSNIGAIDKGREIHAGITQKGFGRDISIGNTLVDMYVKCGLLAEAQEAFDKLPVRDVVSWTALIAGYAEHGPGREALRCFEFMLVEGISPNAVTFLCVLKACGNIGAIDKGREIHAVMAQKGLERGISVGNTLIDMYAKCGSLLEAREVFDKMAFRDVVSWTAMIKGYGMNHEVDMAVQCFQDMQEQGVKPNDITFTCLLTACSRARLVLKGQQLFNVMREGYGIVPTIDHYTSMVDLLAQSGHLYEAEDFLERMPCPPSKETWTALLSACKIYRETELGWRCFQQLIRMYPECAASYVLMAKLYASASRWDDANRIEELRKQAGAKKKPASALIEVNKKVHEFVVGNNESKEISAILDTLSLRMKREGHTPNVDLVLRPITDAEKETALCEHAEKLAIAFGLLNTPQGQTLRVTKNLRMCNDCHNTSQFISRMEKREIIVRDIYHIHHFKEGLCSCTNMY